MQKSNFIVLKFGGSSQCLQGIEVILQKIKEYLELNHRIILVISAVGKTTNNLYGIVNFVENSYETIYEVHKNLCESIKIDFSEIEQLLQNLKQDMLDFRYKPFFDTSQLKLKIISWGEILSSKIVHLYLLKNSIDCEYLNAHMFIRNDSKSEDVDHDTLNLKGEFYCDKQVLHSLIGTKNVFVTQGFIARTYDNKYCVLTRSGSNTSASLIANAVDAEKLEIFTDVCGLFTADPRIVPNAKHIPFIKYNLCQEAAAMGSQIIHPLSLHSCAIKNIPIHVKNTFDPDLKGTVINNHGSENLNNCHTHLISCQNNVSMYQITSLNMWNSYGFAYEIFGIFNEEKIDINIITTSQFSISTTTTEMSIVKLERTQKKLQEKGYNVDLIKNCAIVSIIANNVNTNTSITKTHELVIQNNRSVHMIHYSSNNLTLSYVVNADSSKELLIMLHDMLIK